MMSSKPALENLLETQPVDHSQSRLWHDRFEKRLMAQVKGDDELQYDIL